MSFELRGSMLLYLTITATANFTPAWRAAVIFALTAFFYAAGDIFTTCTFLFGASLANLQLVLGDLFPESQPAHTRRSFGVRWIIQQSWPMALIAVALFSVGITANPIWPTIFQRIGSTIFPEPNHSELSAVTCAWAALSASFITLSVMFSPPLQRLFSHRHLLFLGSISYPMYLLHGTLLRIILVRLLKGQSITKTVTSLNEVGAEILIVQTDFLALIWASLKCLVWMGILVCASVLWRNHIDVAIVRFTKTMEGRMTGNGASTVPADVATVERVPVANHNGDIEKGVESTNS